MSEPTAITIIGAGSWGTALAILLASKHQPVKLWGNNPEELQIIQQERCNKSYLPDVTLPDNIHIYHDLTTALQDTRDILLAVPSHVFKAVLQQLKPLLPANVRLAWGTKGLDPQTGKFLHELVAEVFGSKVPMVSLAGPSFAKEVAHKMPTAIAVASNDAHFGEEWITRLRTTWFRPYLNDDMVGVAIGGVVKNVLAIAVGVSDGLGYGANARCALITRGLAEMVRLGTAFKAKQETFYGLAGMGDLILTCTDNQSRNRRFGLALGQGQSCNAAQQHIGQVVEGFQNAATVYKLAQQHHIDMPIVEQVHAILYQHAPPKSAVEALLLRDVKRE